MIDLNLVAESLYVAYFGRPADVGGLAYWVTVLNNNPVGYQAVSDAFAHSDEYRVMYAGVSNREVVNRVYQHLFGRDADTGGLEYWAGHLDDHSLTIDNLVTAIASGAQNQDAVVYLAKVEVATAFSQHLDLASEQLAYSKPANTAIGVAYLAAIKDEASAAWAMDGAHIDAAIASFEPWTVTGAVVSTVDAAQLVGVQEFTAP